jgi:hypothetical protein
MRAKQEQVVVEQWKKKEAELYEQIAAYQRQETELVRLRAVEEQAIRDAEQAKLDAEQASKREQEFAAQLMAASNIDKMLKEMAEYGCEVVPASEMDMKSFSDGLGSKIRDIYLNQHGGDTGAAWLKKIDDWNK